MTPNLLTAASNKDYSIAMKSLHYLERNHRTVHNLIVFKAALGIDMFFLLESEPENLLETEPEPIPRLL